jgi:hypothetical protein
MTQRTDPPESQRRKPIPVRRLVWTVFLACCGVFGWMKAAQNRKARQDYEAAAQAHERVAATIERLDKATFQRIRDLWDRKKKLGRQRRMELSRQVLEEDLNQGEPFSLRPDEGSRDGRQVATWVDPAGGQEFKLRFRDDEWVGFTSGRSGRSKLQPPKRPRAVYGDTCEQIRKLATGYGPFFWLLSLVLLAGLSLLRTLLRWGGLPRYGQSLEPHCRVLAECLLAFAVVSTVAWLVNPHYSITYRGVTSNDNLFWGAILLAISIPILARMTPARIREAGEARHQLQFSLKSLLLVTVACALVFASAPFGYVVALYAVGGIALYVVVRSLRL